MVHLKGETNNYAVAVSLTVDELDGVVEDVRHEHPVPDGRSRECRQREERARVGAPATQVIAAYVSELHRTRPRTCNSQDARLGYTKNWRNLHDSHLTVVVGVFMIK